MQQQAYIFINKEEGEDQRKKNFIISEHTQKDYNNDMLEKIIMTLKVCLNELKKYPFSDQKDQEPLKKEHKDTFNKYINNFLQEVNSIKQTISQNQEALTIVQDLPQNQIQKKENTKKKKQDAKIIEQNQKNQSLIPLGPNFENEAEKVKNTYDQQIQTEKFQCHIDHQQVLTFLLQSKLKSKMDTFPQCICNERFKITHLLSLENRNLFELLLSQQVENIFENEKKMQNKEVFKCKNSFCSFKCFVEKNVDKGSKFYCTLCEEYSVEYLKQQQIKNKN